MKKIDFEVFGPGQYLYFDIGRLIQVENLTGKSAGDIIRNQELNLGILTALLSIGLRQHGIKNPQWYANKMQELIDQGHEMEEFVQPVVKAIAGSGILGKKCIMLSSRKKNRQARVRRNQKTDGGTDRSPVF